MRGFDAIYRFLASLKLAVLCILTLAAVLAGATFFESFHTTAASRQYIYQNPAFAILLAFLGINIFCAATIRFPWKKRQTGFVVTHVGLLVILVGAFVSLRFADEGQLGMAEGTKSGELVRIDHTVLRVQKVDPESGKTLKPYVLPFSPGVFAWDNDGLRTLLKDPAYRSKLTASRVGLGVSALGLLAFALYWSIKRPGWVTPLRGSLLTSLLIGSVAGFGVFASMTPSGPRIDVLTDPADPFVFVVKDYLPSSLDKKQVAEADNAGAPLAKIALLATPPGSKEPFDAFGGEGWFSAENPRLGRTSKTGGAAMVVYQTVDGPNTENAIDDFLHPPKSPLKDRLARIHYQDKTGASRVYEWVLGDDLVKQTITLPDSDIAVNFNGFDDKPLGEDAMSASLTRATGDDVIHVALFKVRKGGGPEQELMAVASLPMVPNSTKTDDTADQIVRIGYFHPPKLVAQGGPMSGRRAQIEVLSDDRGRMFSRAFNIDGLVGTPGPIAVGSAREIATKSRMGAPLVLKVEDYLPKGRLREVFVPVELPFAHREKAIPAIQAEMTIDGVTKKLSLLRTTGLDRTHWKTVGFPGGTYRVAYDFDRQPFRPHPFTLRLKRFEPGKDPGSGSFATYLSDVELSDPELGLTDESRVITMNEPLTHRGWTFYQSSFDRVPDPETGQPDGVYASFFQVHYDPAWKIVYSGCLLVVTGIFLQFYMRAGVFTDGGKRERERAEAKEAAALAKKAGTPLPPKTKSRTAGDAERFEDL